MRAYQTTANLVRTNDAVHPQTGNLHKDMQVRLWRTCATERKHKEWTGTNVPLVTKMSSRRVYFRAEGSKRSPQSPVAARRVQNWNHSHDVQLICIIRQLTRLSSKVTNTYIFSGFQVDQMGLWTNDPTLSCRAVTQMRTSARLTCQKYPRPPCHQV